MPPRRAFTAITAIAVFLYAVAATAFAPYTWGIRIATAVSIVLVVVVAVRGGWLRWRLGVHVDHRPRDALAGYAGWLLVLGAVLAVQSFNYLGEPRAVYPTISSFGEQIFSIHGIRAAAFAAWMWLGRSFVER